MDNNKGATFTNHSKIYVVLLNGFNVFMKYKFLVILLFFSSIVFSQEIGCIKAKNHFIKLLKKDNLFSLVYSDVISEKSNSENSFHFSNEETIFNIINDGFKNKKDHQIIVQTNKDTIVKFNYKRIRGELLLYVYQNNLTNNTFGRSTFYSKKQISTLFGR
ncbi:hypothetical protein BX611_0574 [Lutibacter oceani]|uniref:Uncharacterized protein n=1 Tax=Lutibacter oceani TaxID=1853311 RepID=A0A3D9S1U5_9FLAO|nr:hypothetical protein [Lutibacter oceani]REE83286.1 hypothetical protein BX611_0574 [Lutibacter oceani]